MNDRRQNLYAFGAFRMDPAREVLLCGDTPIPLTSKAFHTLLVLVENSGQVMSKEQLMASLWPGTFVEEANLAKHISMVRKALGQTAQDRGYIVTIPGSGYRFSEPVHEISAEDSEIHANQANSPAPHHAGKGSLRSIFWAVVTVAAILVTAALVTYRLIHPRASPASPTARDTVLVVDFLNTTGDPVFDGTLQQALVVSLNQSPFLNILSENKTEATLRMMGRSAGEPLTPDLARELCQRAGCQVYISGSIVNIGAQYVLGLKAVDCSSGDTLALEQTTAPTKENVLKALDAATTKLRTQLGESLTTVREFDVPLEQATTASLDALRAYSMGRRESAEQGPRVALPYDQKAIQLDPDFAMGYFAVGYDYFILGEVAQASQYFKKAFELSADVSEREKLTIAAAYYQSVTGELDKAVQTDKEQIASYPRDAKAYLGLAIVYGQQGEYETAADMARQAVQLTPNDAASYGILAYNLIALQQLQEARQTIEQATARKLDDFVARQVLYALAFLNNDPDSMRQQAAWFTGKATVENSGLSLESDTEAYFGHLRRARELTAQAVDSARRNGHNENAAIWLANAALREAAFGNVSESRHLAGEAFKMRQASQAVESASALALAMSGDNERATSLAQDLNHRFPADTQTHSLWLPTIQSQIDLNRKNPRAALNQLNAAASMDLAAIQSLTNVSCLNSVYERGQAYLAAGNGNAAALEFQKILNHSGIVWNCWTGALAHLGLARANALESRTLQGPDANAARIRALTAYTDFFGLCKDADPDIPIVNQAKAEYARLQ